MLKRLFIFKRKPNMNFKSKNVKSILSYNLGGITNIWLLNIKHFTAYKFKDDSLADRCTVEQIIASDTFFELESINESNYTENFTDNVYQQKLSTFIYPLSGQYSSHIASIKNEKYIVVFRTHLNRMFCFGSDGGASLSFTQQTGQGDGIQGYSISIGKDSTNSLFEILNINNIQIKHKYSPIFEDGVFCQLRNGLKTGFEIAKYVLKTNTDNEALDVNGNLCSDSLLPQAILLLEGFKRPEENYEIEAYYKDGTSHIQGYSIIRYNSICEPHSSPYFYLSTSQIIFDSKTNEVIINLVSSLPWKLSTPSSLAVFSKGEGGPGIVEIKVTKSTTEGNENALFVSGDTSILLNIINSNNPLEWVLKSEDNNNYFWNENGYWLNDHNWS